MTPKKEPRILLLVGLSPRTATPSPRLWLNVWQPEKALYPLAPKSSEQPYYHYLTIITSTKY